MGWAIQLLEQFSDIVIIQGWKAAHVEGPKSGAFANSLSLGRQDLPQALVHRFAHGLTGLTHLRADTSGDVVVQGQRSAHILRLAACQSEVNAEHRWLLRYPLSPWTEGNCSRL